MFRGPPSKFGRRYQPLDSFPLFAAQVAGIAGALHAFAIALATPNVNSSDTLLVPELAPHLRAGFEAETAKTMENM
jgi:hypothetical protein